LARPCLGGEKETKMSISEIKEKLYKKKKEKDLSKYDKIDFDVRKSSIDPKEAGFEKKGDDWVEEKDEIKEERNKAVKIAGIALVSLLVIAALMVGFYFFKKTSFNIENVNIQISGPKDVASGKKLQYEILIENKNRAKLEGAVLKVSYPESFIPENNPDFTPEGLLGGSFQLGNIKGKESKKIIFNGKIYSPKGTIVYLKNDLLFYPAGFNGQFSVNNQFDLNVTSSPITLNLMAPQNMSSDDSLDYLIVYKNEGKEDYNNVKIKMEYPDGFAFSKSEPSASEGENYWYIGRLSAGQEDRIVVSGKLSGESGNTKVAKVYIGEMIEGQFMAQNEEKVATKIESSPLFISQTVNGLKELNVNAGENLRFSIYYKNEGEIGLKDVIVTGNIDSAVLDYEKIKMRDKGSINMKNKTITWKAADVPELKNLNPGDSGTIDFEIKIKDIIPVAGVQDKNFVISSIAKIDSPDIQTPIQGNKIISGNKMDIKLNSKLFLNVKGLYHDAFTENFGPIPPRVGQETSYIIKWTAMNVSNDISEAKVKAALPPMVSFTGKIYPENSDLTFNERTNNIVWDIGNLNAGTGVLTASKEVSFQVKITPAPNQKDKYADILSQSIMTGKDLFTKSELSFAAGDKTTYMVDDKKVGEDGYKVKE